MNQLEQNTPKGRFCVFCGKNPESKTNEHVLPHWLMELTGDPKRVVSLGPNWGANLKELPKIEPFEFSFNNFVAPACDTCNGEYSDFEGHTKEIILRLIENESLSAMDFDQLLNWFDKTRTGLWLQYMMLNKNRLGIRPHYFINDRIGIKDRVLLIYKFPNYPDGLSFAGPETVLFQLTPCCYMLRINKLMFVNISTDFLIARRCGFPAPKKPFWLVGADNGGLEFDSGGMVKLNRMMSPIMNMSLHKPLLHILQPILYRASHLEQSDNELYGVQDSNDPYLRENCMNFDAGKGKIIVQRDTGVEVINNSEEKIAWNRIHHRQAVKSHQLSAMTYRLQSDVAKLIPIKGATDEINANISKQYRAAHELNLAMSKMHIDLHKKNAYRPIPEKT